MHPLPCRSGRDCAAPAAAQPPVAPGLTAPSANPVWNSRLNRFPLIVSTGLALVLGVSARGQDAASAAEHIEGQWLGTAGNPENRAVLGLEIKRNAKGELNGALYLDLLNLYNSPLPSFHADGGGKYSVPEFGLELTLAGDRLDGTLSGKAPVGLQRTAGDMPADPPVPEDLPRGPGPRWQTKLGAPIFATAAVRAGMAYVGTTGGVFHAIKVSDGSFSWTFSAGRPIHGEALATEGAVYFVCDNGYLFKLERASGKEIWRYDLGDARVSRVLPHQIVYDYDHSAAQPVLADGVVFVGSGDGGFNAVKDADGTRVWRVETKGKIRTAAAVHGANIVFGNLDGLICMVEQATGREVWRFDSKAPVTSSPVIIGGRLIIGNRGSALYGINPATGERDWRVSFWGSWVESTAVPYRDGLAYIGSSDLRRVSCIDPKDGRIVWRTDVFGAPWGRPVVTEKFVYAGAESIQPYMIRHVGGFCALDRLTGRLVWRWPVTNPPGVLSYGFSAGPALVDATLVIGGLDGTLYAFPVQ